MQIECFLLTETPYVRRSLRRFAFSTQRQCPVANPYGSCDASVVIAPALQKPRQGKYETSPDRDDFEGDPRWPAVCTFCGLPFAPEDQWQVNDQRLWENRERGIVTTLRWDETPVGAMWFADWLDSFGSTQWKQRGGGPHLMVMTPGGTWDVDMGAGNDPSGGGWSWSGTPPNVTATPSILIANKYHGWLTDGKLIAC